ncbi:MAG: glycosyltransferase [Shimia sp.]|uniref:glycosyltransferase n=1 Tax=Shimia sp. TaxID=1954381 RepID=UPI003B8E52A0
MTSPSQTISQGQIPAISIIVPVFNVEDHVIACLRSIEKQSWTDFEVIVVDDGSTDGSGPLAAQFCQTDARFHFIFQSNRGLSGARNTGLEYARAEVISFVDSDDRIAPDFLELLYGALQSTGCDWVACAVKSCHPDGHITSHSAIHGASDFFESSAPRRFSFDSWTDVICHFPSAWNKLYRRRLIEGLTFDEGTWFEDHSFFQRAAARTDHLVHLPRALYLQTRGREGQITTADSDRVFEQLQVLRGLRGIMEQGPHRNARQAYERLASRLVFERSLSLRNPDRRVRFAKEAAQFFRSQALTYAPQWDDDIALSWGLEMSGELPLTVFIDCRSEPQSELKKTLDSLSQLIGPGIEVILLARSATKAQSLATDYPDVQIVDLCQLSIGVPWSKARGRFVTILRSGVTVDSALFFQQVEQLLRHDAQMALSAYLTPDDTGEPAYCTGFADVRAFGLQPLEKGVVTIDGTAGLALLPEVSARVFDRRFLINQKLTYTKLARSDWAFQLNAAVLAPRVVFNPWAGLIVPQPEREKIRIGPAHDRLIEALPQTVQNQLPSGWQRRLFDRSYKAIQSVEAPRRAPKLSASNLGTMWDAFRRGLHGVSPTEASFDPPFDATSQNVLDPVGTFASLLGRTRTRSLALQQRELDVRYDVRRDRSARSALLLFPATASSAFTFLVDVCQSPFANLNVFAADGVTVPVHFSFRREAKCIVFNRQDKHGWGEEHSWPYNFDQPVLKASLQFQDDVVGLTIDGVEFCKVPLAAALQKPDTDGLVYSGIEYQGNIKPLGFVVEPPEKTVTLDKRLVLQAAYAADGHQIRELTTDTVLPVTPLDGMTHLPGLRTLLPARLWASALSRNDAALRFQLETTDGDTVGAPLGLGRQDMIRRLKTLLHQRPTFSDTTLVLAILEHVAHGRLFPELSDTERKAVQVYASFFGVEGVLKPSVLGSEDCQDLSSNNGQLSGTSKPDPMAQEIDLAQMYLAKSLESGQAVSPLDTVANMPVPFFAAQKVYLSMAEVFARHDQDFEAYFTFVKNAGVQAFKVNGEHWHDSCVLPFLFMQGDMESVIVTLRRLARRGGGPVSTVSIAWVLRKSLKAEALSDRQRQHFLFLWGHLLSRLGRGYWEPVQCRELLLAALDLAAQFDEFSASQKGNALWICLRNYGLSRQFWAMLPVDVPSQELKTARLQFSHVLNYKDDPNLAQRALLFFDRNKCPDVSRFRYELFGPSGVALKQNTPPDLASLQQVHDDPALAGLRYFAAPGTDEPSDQLSQMVADRVSDLSQDQTPSPLLKLQGEAGAAIAKLLADPNESVDRAQIERLLGLCDALASAQSNFLGIALQLVLVNCFGTSNSKKAYAAEIVTRIRAHVTDLGASEKEALAASLPVQMSLKRLWRDGGNLDVVGDLEALLLGQGALARAHLEPQDALPTGSPLYDAIVTVFSCKSHLKTRIPTLREGWLRLLDGLGVPYFVVVGDGDNRQRGDVVYLDAPDTYEGLPQKTLATIDWVYRNTGYAHMVKVDDDCFFNAPLFFQSLTYRKYDYYGRKLTRQIGQLDRLWHQKKSISDRGRMDLDKSPEPSTYADGGSGYSLSRRAMKEALVAAGTTFGEQLLQVSFLEDKLLGDLLALRGISVSEEGYTVTVRRRANPDAIPVPSWHNGFNASRSAPVQLVHMDTTAGQREAMERLDAPELTPKKIWPSYQDPCLGYQSNALELVSPVSRTFQAREAAVALVACMRNEMFMLPHFLAHYRKLGVECFLIADNASDDGTLECLAEQPDVAVFSVDTDYSEARYGVAWQQALLAEYRVGKWSLVADADELLVWQEQQTQTLPELLADPEFERAEAVRLFMLDMYPAGALKSADFTDNPFDQARFCDRTPFLQNTPYRGPFSDQPTWTSALRHRLIPGSRPDLFVAQKLALLRYQPWMRLAAGMHYIADARLAARQLILAHFKYNSEFWSKAQSEVARGQHFNNAEEYRKYKDLQSKGQGVLYDPDLSTLWTRTAFAQEIFAQSPQAPS